MKIGRRLYFDIATGNVIVDTGERSGSVVETTIDYDIKVYKALSDRNRESFDVIQLEYGQYAEDFATCSGYRVNPATKQLEFSYPEPGEPEPQPPAYRPPLSEQLEQTKARVADLELTLAELVSSKK
ncbi:hypothetical protein NDS46_25130 [Paenibacillus thiaminolyticus]|uniref:hypothetical protein n=1 Tax=Paenibacillus thiaminolyticus TaxID=49283 RepID=UPI00232AF85F|nr:hypothetical protein [Paenibacillus thiaminolyticus]WCF07554.1 hypothetical protein NDS46_25130 [Paenibacillus thiaminolyticus]